VLTGPRSPVPGPRSLVEPLSYLVELFHVEVVQLVVFPLQLFHVEAVQPGVLQEVLAQCGFSASED
jgi:hypothetical protein